ncbi:hypothetical protein PO909_016358 [Leuciscus waleckii]
MATKHFSVILLVIIRPGTYAWILFVDFSLAFNTIMPDLLTTDPALHADLSLSVDLQLSDRQTAAGETGETLTISTGAPQGCILSTALLPYTHDCSSKHSSVKLLKTLIGFIQNGVESAYSQKVKQLSQQPGAEHTLNSGDDRGLQEEHLSTQ